MSGYAVQVGGQLGELFEPSGPARIRQAASRWGST